MTAPTPDTIGSASVVNFLEDNESFFLPFLGLHVYKEYKL